MIILTGGAGFIGSVLLHYLNEAGYTDILIVDAIEPAKTSNLADKKYSNYIYKKDFIHHLQQEVKPEDVEAIFHLGACTSTTERDLEYLRENNIEFSQHIAEWCFKHDKRLIYASSAATYGDGKLGFSDSNEFAHQYKPLNPYGNSKHLFDLWLIDNGLDNRCAGFKFFNVFGPNEYHKGDMASLVYKAYHQIQEFGHLRLFKSCNPDYKDGEFKRDFIYVKDCVDVLMWAFQHPEVNGIMNLGTGEARSWNDLANALFSAIGKEPAIEYIDMPLSIRDAYQYFTEADMSKLRAAGYDKPFSSLEQTVADYAGNYLMQDNPYL